MGINYTSEKQSCSSGLLGGGGGGDALSVTDHGSGDKWDRISWQTGFSPDDRKDQNC